MARPHLTAATPVAALVVAAAVAAPARAQQPSAFAGPRAVAAAGALPGAVARDLRAAERRAAAQPPRATPKQPVRYSLAAGISQPTGDLGDVANTGFNVTGSADFRPANFPFGLRADLSVNRFTGDEDEVGDDVSLTLIGAQLNGIVRFAGSAPQGGGGIRPYILGGLGAYRSSVSDGDDSEDEIVLGFGFGGGFEFRMGTRDAFLEARYQTVSTNDTADDGVSFIPIVVGIRF